MVLWLTSAVMGMDNSVPPVSRSLHTCWIGCALGALMCMFVPED